MGPFEQDKTQGLTLEDPKAEIILFGAMDVMSTSDEEPDPTDPNQGSWI